MVLIEEVVNAELDIEDAFRRLEESPGIKRITCTRSSKPTFGMGLTFVTEFVDGVEHVTMFNASNMLAGGDDSFTDVLDQETNIILREAARREH